MIVVGKKWHFSSSCLGCMVGFCWLQPQFSLCCSSYGSNIELLLSSIFLLAPRPDILFDAHDGPIKLLQRSPFFSDILLTVGGWTFSIWKEGVTVTNCFYIYIYVSSENTTLYNVSLHQLTLYKIPRSLLINL